MLASFTRKSYLTRAHAACLEYLKPPICIPESISSVSSRSANSRSRDYRNNVQCLCSSSCEIVSNIMLVYKCFLLDTQSADNTLTCTFTHDRILSHFSRGLKIAHYNYRECSDFYSFIRGKIDITTAAAAKILAIKKIRLLLFSYEKLLCS